LPAPSEPEPRIFLVRKLLPQSTIVWARLGPARTDPRFYPLDMADYVVGSGGFQARLVREIRSNRGLAYSVGSFYEALPDFGVLGAFAQTKVESTLEVTDLMRELLAQVAASGLEAAEVERAKEALINRHVFRYQDPANAVRDQMRLSLDGLPSDLPASFPARIAAVSPREVAEATRASYDPSLGITVVVGDLAPDHPHWRRGPPVTAVDVE
jgi:zinc protease